MLTGILIGAGAVLALGLLAALTDPSTRHELAEILGAVVGIPATVVIVALLAVVRRFGSVQRVSPEGMRRFASSASVRAVSIHRPYRNILIITQPRPKRADHDD